MDTIRQGSLAAIIVTALITVAACGSSEDITATDVSVTTTGGMETTSTSVTTTAGTEITDDAPDVASLYESAGNPDAETVVVFAQGGPNPRLDSNGFSLLTEGLDLDELFVVNVHQAQTLDPERFLAADIDFDAAKAADDESVQIAADVVDHFRTGGKRVVVLGISFGAALVQDLLATQGNVADAYVIIVGRLESPEEAWRPFSEGRTVEFIDGTEVVEVPIEQYGFGTGTAAGERNMARLVAGFDYNRYTDLLADVDLSNVTYGYAEMDEYVGRLTENEIAFLVTAGAEVVSDPGGHVDAIFALTGPALAGALP